MDDIWLLSSCWDWSLVSLNTMSLKHLLLTRIQLRTSRSIWWDIFISSTKAYLKVSISSPLPHFYSSLPSIPSSHSSKIFPLWYNSLPFYRLSFQFYCYKHAWNQTFNLPRTFSTMKAPSSVGCCQITTKSHTMPSRFLLSATVVPSQFLM